MKTEDVIDRVLELLHAQWADLAIAALKEKYGEGYSGKWIADEPRFYEPDFRVTHEYTMELMGVPQ